MRTLLKAARVWLFVAAFGAAAVPAACGGGGGSSSPAPAAPPVAQSLAPALTPSPSPTPTPSPAPLPVTTTVPVPQATTTTQALPATGGFTGQINFPPAQVSDPNTTLSVTTTTTPDSDIPPLPDESAAVLRRPMAARTTYVTIKFQASATLTFSGLPAFSFTLPSNVNTAGKFFFLGLFDRTKPNVGWQLGVEGPGTVFGQTVVFNGGSTPFVLQKGVTYDIALYSQSSPATPSPTPSPPPSPVPSPTASGATPSPSPSPSPSPGVVVVSPPSLAFLATQQTQTLIVSELGYTGTYTAVSSNKNVATVSASGPGAFTVTSIGAGNAEITVADTKGNAAIVLVTVTVTLVPLR